MKNNFSITKEIKNTENNTKRDRKTRLESAISPLQNTGHWNILLDMNLVDADFNNLFEGLPESRLAVEVRKFWAQDWVLPSSNKNIPKICLE